MANGDRHDDGICITYSWWKQEILSSASLMCFDSRRPEICFNNDSSRVPIAIRNVRTVGTLKEGRKLIIYAVYIFPHRFLKNYITFTSKLE